VQVIIIGGGKRGTVPALSPAPDRRCPAGLERCRAEPACYGLNLQPNAIRELSTLAWRKTRGGRPSSTKNARLLQTARPFDLDRARAAAPPASLAADFNFSRELHKTCSLRSTQRPGAAAIRFTAIAYPLRAAGDTVIARTILRSVGPAVRRAEGDILNRADGIHSAVRRSSTGARRRCSRLSALSRYRRGRALSHRPSMAWSATPAPIAPLVYPVMPAYPAAR